MCPARAELLNAMMMLSSSSGIVVVLLDRLVQVLPIILLCIVSCIFVAALYSSFWSEKTAKLLQVDKNSKCQTYPFIYYFSPRSSDAAEAQPRLFRCIGQCAF